MPFILIIKEYVNWRFNFSQKNNVNVLLISFLEVKNCTASPLYANSPRFVFIAFPVYIWTSHSKRGFFSRSVNNWSMVSSSIELGKALPFSFHWIFLTHWIGTSSSTHLPTNCCTSSVWAILQAPFPMVTLNLQKKLFLIILTHEN